MNRPTTNLPVCSRAILWCTHPNAKCIIARQLPIYFLNLHETEPTGLGIAGLLLLKVTLMVMFKIAQTNSLCYKHPSDCVSPTKFF